MANKRHKIDRTSEESSEWSFSCRTTHYSAYDDSDSDSDSNPGQDGRSGAARLLDELDLSSREETVLYKPNPFSIAKINAASRGPPGPLKAKVHDNPPPASVSLPRAKPGVKARLAGSNGNIIDGFKRQAQRNSIRRPERKPDASLTPSLPISRPKADHADVHPTISFNDKLKPASTRPLVPHSKTPNGPLTRPDQTLATTVPAIDQCPNLPLTQKPPSSSLISAASLIHDPIPGPAHIPSQNTPTRHEMLHIPASTVAPVEQRSRTAYRAHPLPFSSPPRHQATNSELSSSDGFHTYDTMPMAMSSPIRPSPLMGFKRRFDSPIHSRNRPRTSDRFSNQLRPAGRLAPPFAYGSAGGGIEYATRRPDFDAPFPSADAPAPSYDALTMLLPSPSYDARPPDPTHAPFQSADLNLSPPAFNAQRPITPAHMTTYSDRGHPLSTSTLTASNTNMNMDYNSPSIAVPVSQTIAKDVPPLQMHRQYLYPIEPSQIRHSHIKRKRDPSVSPSPSPSPPRGVRGTTSFQDPRARKKDAYAFVGADPDESWSTLPSRKKAKPTVPNSVRKSGKFSLPRLGVRPAGRETRKTGMEATSVNRVIVYLPPPPAAAAVKSASSIAISVRHEYEEEAVATRVSANASNRRAYPSPTHSSSSPFHGAEIASACSSPSPPAKQTAMEKDAEVYAPLSPPPSDSFSVPAIHEHEDDRRMDVDLGAIGRVYPDMKAAWRKRRRKSEGVWDLLGLPSCGRVYCDGEEDEEGYGEIGIVIFRGLE